MGKPKWSDLPSLPLRRTYTEARDHIWTTKSWYDEAGSR
jgi:hypothetical protein